MNNPGQETHSYFPSSQSRIVVFFVGSLRPRHLLTTNFTASQTHIHTLTIFVISRIIKCYEMIIFIFIVGAWINGELLLLGITAKWALNCSKAHFKFALKTSATKSTYSLWLFLSFFLSLVGGVLDIKRKWVHSRFVI